MYMVYYMYMYMYLKVFLCKIYENSTCTNNYWIVNFCYTYMYMYMYMYIYNTKGL